MLLTLCLASCSTFPPPVTVVDADYQQKLLQMEHWSLRGRLNIRSNNDSETININWQQDADAFAINLSGTLGLGAVHIAGDTTGVVIEKAGEEPLQADSLETISTDILGYAFPAGELLYWIRGLPAPGRRADITYTSEGLVATLSQPDAQGRRWELQYDNYQEIAGHILPGRLRLEQSPYRLTFLISDWDIPSGDGS